MVKSTTILMIGLGDLAERIARVLVSTVRFNGVLILAGHSRDKGSELANLLRVCYQFPIIYRYVDGLSAENVEELLIETQPDLIIQCGSLVSPWLLTDATPKLSALLQDIGFALHLCNQLPMIETLMTVRNRLLPHVPVVNCSYPDVTHPVLAAHGLQPTIGVGNAGMIQRVLEAHFDSQGHGSQVHALETGAPKTKIKTDIKTNIKVIAHHAHVKAFATNQHLYRVAPRVFKAGVELVGDAYHCPPLAAAPNRSLNELTAVHAVDVIAALIDPSITLHTSAPGPLGLPGGWPISIRDAQIRIDLPQGVTLDEAKNLNLAAMQGDGIERIDRDGLVHFTESFRASLPTELKAFGEPMSLSDARTRSAQLISLFKSLN